MEYELKNPFPILFQILNHMQRRILMLNSGGKEILAWFEGKVAKWWIPDDVLFVESLPHTATGKLSKVELRKMYGDHRLPSEEAR